MSSRQVSIPFDHLTHISYCCQNCGAIVVADVAEKTQKDFIVVEQKTCPVCSVALPRGLFLGIKDYIDWIKCTQRHPDQKVRLVIGEDALNDAD